MPKYLDMTAHYEVSVDELLGKKPTEAPPKQDEKTENNASDGKGVKSE